MSDNSARKGRVKATKNERIPFDEALRRMVNTPPKPKKAKNTDEKLRKSDKDMPGSRKSQV